MISIVLSAAAAAALAATSQAPNTDTGTTSVQLNPATVAAPEARCIAPTWHARYATFPAAASFSLMQRLACENVVGTVDAEPRS